MVELPSSCIPNFARGLNILLVDDDTASLMYLASLLEQYTYKVTTTRLATVALSMIREEKDKFKLVMANVNVPNMDGLKFIRELFKKKIPVIAISSERSVATAFKAMKAGASLCLDKPISLYDLKYLWQYVFEKTVICRVKVNIRKISQGIVVRDEGRKTEVPDGIVLNGAADYQNATAPSSKGKGQVVGFKDLDATNRQQMMAVLEVEILEDSASRQQMKADPKGDGMQIEGEIILNGSINDQQMIIPNANSGDKGKQVDAQVWHRINNYNQPMTQMKTEGRKNGVEQVAIAKENFTKEAESTAIEMPVLAEIQKQDESVITRSQQQSGSKRPTDGDEGRRNKERRVEANAEIIYSGTKINLEKQKEIECNRGEETERFENNINTDSSTEKRPRLIWNQDLQMKFMSAISALGDQKARPKKILEKMNVSCLSQRQVSSHLQKYKAQIRRIYDHATTDSSPLNEPSPFNSGTGVSLLEKTGSVRDQVGNQGSDYGIEGDKSEILKAPTDGVNQNIVFSCLSGNRNKAPLMSAGTSQGQQGYGGEHFTIEKVANAIKLATTSTGRNRKLDCITPSNPTSGNVRDAIKFPTISTDENRNLDPKVSNPKPDNITNTDEFMKDLNEVIQELDAIAVTGPPSCSLDQSPSLSDFTHMLKLFEEEPVNSNSLADESSPDEVARYLDSLSEFLLKNDSPQP